MKNCYPLPLINELLNQHIGAVIFSKIYLTAGYNQVCVAEKDNPKRHLGPDMAHIEFLS